MKVLNKYRLKKYIQDEHTVEEHIEKIYETLLELIDELDDLKRELEEGKSKVFKFSVYPRRW